MSRAEAKRIVSALEFALESTQKLYEAYNPEQDASGYGLNAAFEYQREMAEDIQVSKQLLARLSEFAK